MKFEVNPHTASAIPMPPAASISKIVTSIQELNDFEINVLSRIDEELRGLMLAALGDRRRTDCDKVFGQFTHDIVIPYAKSGMASKASDFAARKLIPAVMKLEQDYKRQFHKGALFYDTALAFLMSGDESRFEYYLAMADEEDYLTHGVEGKPQERGMHNKKVGSLTSQTIQESVHFAVKLANGAVLSSRCPLTTVLGGSLTDQKMNDWREKLDGYHHAELFRILNELRVFCGDDMPHYTLVGDNPYVMLRLGKVLAHIAQWAESQLTLLQTGTVSAKTLHPKLAKDPHLKTLIAVAGVDTTGDPRFPGKNVSGANVDSELRSLLADIQIQTDTEQRTWRVLRVLYIIRNCTAHEIETTLDFYKDRQYLLDLIQTSLVAAFVIQQSKGIVVV